MFMGKKVLDYLRTITLLSVFFFGLSASAATIESTANGGNWSVPSTWIEGIIPTETDDVVINGQVSIDSNKIISSLLIEETGTISSNSTQANRNIQVNGDLTNNGQIETRISINSHGNFFNNGSMSQVHTYVSLYGDEQGRVSLSGDLPNTRLENNIALFSDMNITGVFTTNGYVISAAQGIEMIFNSAMTEDLHILGTPTVRTQSNVHGINAPGADLYIAGQLFGENTVLAKNVFLEDGVTLSVLNKHIITADIITIESGAVFDFYVPSSLKYYLILNGTIINYGSLGGEAVYVTINGHLDNRGVVRRIKWGADAAGTGSIIGDDFSDISFEGSAGQVELSSDIILTDNLVSNITLIPYDKTIMVQGDQVIEIDKLIGTNFDLIGKSTLTLRKSSSYKGTINALDTQVILSGGSLEAATINADSVLISGDVGIYGNDFRNRKTTTFNVLNGVVVQPEARLFNNKTSSYGIKSGLTIYGDLNNQGTIETVAAPGYSSDLSVNVYGNVHNTGIWVGNSMKLRWLPEDGIDYDDIEYIASVTEPGLSGADVISGNSINIKGIIDESKQLYIRFRTLEGSESFGRWSEVFSVNKPIDPISTPEDFFNFDFIQDVTLSNKPTITIYANDPTYAGPVTLSAGANKLYPTVVSINNGVWTGPVEFFEGHGNQTIHVSGTGSGVGKRGESNQFDVVDQILLTGMITGIARNGDGTPAVELIYAKNRRGGRVDSIAVSAGEYELIISGNGTYDLYADGHVEKLGTVSVQQNQVVVKDLSIPENCSDAYRVPVLLVPGIEGSDRVGHRGWFPELYRHTPAWDSGELEVHDPSLIGDAANGLGGFGNLTDRLTQEEDGYQMNCNVFHVPYDWSISVTDAADQYLKPWIDHAKQVSGSARVDIVAHSMGGLVTRSYIQGTNYGNDIRKFAMVGTPNQGSVQSYFSWEGGDPIQADTYGGSWIDNLGADVFGADQFQTETLSRNYVIKTGNINPCSRAAASRLVGNTFVSTENSDIYGSCNNSALRNFLRTYAPAVGELFPTYPFLLNKQGEYITPKYENKLLRALNDQNCETVGDCGYSFVSLQERATADSSPIQIKLFVGVEENSDGSNFISTPKTVVVKTSISVEEVYTDGKVVDAGVFEGVGDGTVLQSSVESVYSNQTSTTTNVGHATLINAYRQAITNFITD